MEFTAQMVSILVLIVSSLNNHQRNPLKKGRNDIVCLFSAQKILQIAPAP